jgi:hypothetical protein
MITFYPTLKETLWYLLGPSWVPAENVGMTARHKESEDTFFLKPAISRQASSGTRHCIGCQIEKPTSAAIHREISVLEQKVPSALTPSRLPPLQDSL